MRWIPMVHDDGRTVGLLRVAETGPVGVHWVGSLPHPISPEGWQDLLGRIAPHHRGSGPDWLFRAAGESIRGLGGEVFDAPRVELPEEKPAEGDLLVQRTLEVAHHIEGRLRDVGRTWPDVDALSAAIERSLTPYDRAVLDTALAPEDLPRWCRSLAARWTDLVSDAPPA